MKMTGGQGPPIYIWHRAPKSLIRPCIAVLSTSLLHTTLMLCSEIRFIIALLLTLCALQITILLLLLYGQK